MACELFSSEIDNLTRLFFYRSKTSTTDEADGSNKVDNTLEANNELFFYLLEIVE